MPVRYSSLKYSFEPDIIDTLGDFKLAVFHEYYIQKPIKNAIHASIILGISFKQNAIEEADKFICISQRQAEIVAKTIHV